MLAGERRELILSHAEAAGEVRVSDLTELLGVSDMTVRRDLNHLERHGWLRKVHGGAILAPNSTQEIGFEAKRDLEQPAKRAIAARALAMIEPNMAIGISAGTTTWTLARLILESGMPLSVVTNSTTVADVLSSGTGADRVTVVLTGGTRTPSAALVGPVADRAIAALHVDRLFLGVHGMDSQAGFTTPNLAEAATNAALMRNARQVVVLADSTKWQTVGLAGFGPLSAADVLITDDGLSPDARRQLTDDIEKLIVVPATGYGPD